MSHYRIVETGEGFVVESRFLWFFWTEAAEPCFKYDGCSYIEIEPQIWIYETLNDAKGSIHRRNHMFYDYKDHTITYYIDSYGEKGFIDLNSKYKSYDNKIKYSIGGKTLQEVKMKIDNIKEMEEEVNKKKVTNIYYV